MRYTFSLLSCLVACLATTTLVASVASTPATAPVVQERTLLLIKPNAVAAGHIGSILTRVETAGLRIIGLHMQKLSKEQAETFYAEHKERPFFAGLVNFMSSAPLVAVAVEGPDAVARIRTLLGATNPKQAAAGTIRADFGLSVEENAGHGSDSRASAQRELLFLFPHLTPET